MAQIGSVTLAQSAGHREPEPQPPIQTAFDRIAQLRCNIGGALQALSETVDTLEKRIGTALMPAPPMAEQETGMALEGKRVTPMRSTMADIMDNEAEALVKELGRIEALTERLVSIRHRVELPR